ncbi:hypothetical protein [Acidovorax sp. SUPP2539]|uniref:hypothetical protein n=1 Tax=Acidovorax sp. SUPP2539 TaxID=2920878 RepID=UPI0023DE491D|nr:hypothetical protein [Acidovorax sp. SUPP2539]GKS92616.1 hypothetical protein AVTE2539_24645 [Acidovorax sp. SUPP2539]
MADTQALRITFEEYASRIIDRLVAELDTFDKVLSDWELIRNAESDPAWHGGGQLGNLSFSMTCAAISAFDAFARAIYEDGEQVQKVGNKVRMKSLLDDSRFFDARLYGNSEVFYTLVRCGVMHQVHPVNIGLASDKSSSRPLTKNGEHFTLNAYALYLDILRGLKEVHKFAKSDENWCLILNNNCCSLLERDAKSMGTAEVMKGLNSLPSISNTPVATQPPLGIGVRH